MLLEIFSSHVMHKSRDHYWSDHFRKGLFNRSNFVIFPNIWPKTPNCIRQGRRWHIETTICHIIIDILLCPAYLRCLFYVVVNVTQILWECFKHPKKEKLQMVWPVWKSSVFDFKDQKTRWKETDNSKQRCIRQPEQKPLS